MIRSLLTIGWFEFRMHLQTWRWRGLALLALLFNFGVYQAALMQYRFLPRENLISNGILPLYLAAVVFAGLHAMGRIRESGIRSMLMTKSFPTIVLPAGLWLGGMAAMTLLFVLALFPAALVLHSTTEIIIYLRPLLWVLIFNLLPAAGLVLALTLWIRACYRNNLMALIILGLIFGALLVLANTLFQASKFGDAVYFHPLTAPFSVTWWMRLDSIQVRPQVSFADLAEWRRVLWSIAAAALFMHLTTYHLRRTEPQRKVLGTYGSSWADMPTFVRMVADLRIDPHVGWRAHLALGSLVIALLIPARRPLEPVMMGLLAKLGLARETSYAAPAYSPHELPGEKILPVWILHDEQLVTPRQVRSELTVVIDQPTSGRVAIMGSGSRSRYQVQRILVDGTRMPFGLGGWNAWHFIPGSNLAPYADGKPHKLTVEAGWDKSLVVADSSYEIADYPLRGYVFFDRLTPLPNPSTGEVNPLFDEDHTLTWSTRLTLRIETGSALMEDPPGFIGQRKDAAGYIERVYELASSQNRPDTKLVVGRSYVAERVPDSELALTVWAPERDAPILREILPLARPMLEDFYRLRRIPHDSPIAIAFDTWESREFLQSVASSFAMARRRQSQFTRDQLVEKLSDLQQKLLSEIIEQHLVRSGAMSAWDLSAFLRVNAERGLNHHLLLRSTFVPRDHIPVSAVINPFGLTASLNKTRAELINGGSPPQAFQMLYLVLGDEAWYDMVEKLLGNLKESPFSVDMLRETAAETAGEDLSWFFDYWTGEEVSGFPIYRVLTAEADQITTGPEESTLYRVRAQIRERGRGRMPVPVRLKTTEGEINDKLWIGEGETATWRVDSTKLPQSVVVDPQGWILRAPYFENGSWVLFPEKPVVLEQDEVSAHPFSPPRMSS